MLLCSKGESISVEMLANGLKRAQNDERCDGIITRFRDGCEISLPQMERVRASLLAFNDNTKKPSIFLTDSIGDLNDGSIVLLAVMLSVVPLSVCWINEYTDSYIYIYISLQACKKCSLRLRTAVYAYNRPASSALGGGRLVCTLRWHARHTRVQSNFLIRICHDDLDTLPRLIICVIFWTNSWALPCSNFGAQSIYTRPLCPPLDGVCPIPIGRYTH